jgi:hypothetical protein
MRTLRRTFLTAFLVSVASVSAQASSALTTLYTFAGSPNDGAGPLNVMVDTSGVLFGTTQRGGKTGCDLGCGTLFSLTPPAAPGGAWTETVYIFPGGGKGGSYPGGGVVIGTGGVLYGVTLEGGSSNNGTVFTLRESGGSVTERVPYRFTGASGSEPEAGVVIGSGGVLYGTTAASHSRRRLD